jgi:hypothetical protein
VSSRGNASRRRTIRARRNAARNQRMSAGVRCWAASAWLAADRDALIGVTGLYMGAVAGLGMMSSVDVDYLVSRADLGPVAAFRGFNRSDVWTMEHDWGFTVEARAAACDGTYLIEREEWSDRGTLARSRAAAVAEGLARVAAGAEDAVAGAGGVVWLAPGRPHARVALDPDCGDPVAGDELIGAALTHALALAGRVPIHGLAAEVDGVGVLALGDSMAGKSTLALAILHAGGRVVSDDLLLARSLFGRPIFGALRRDLYIREGSYSLIPDDLRARCSEDGAGPGRLVLRRDSAPEAFTAEVSAAVVWILDGTRESGNCEVAAMSQAEALGSLVRAGSPLFVSGRYHAERRALLPGLVEIAESSRSCSVRLGPSLFRRPWIVVRELLERTRPGGG